MIRDFKEDTKAAVKYLNGQGIEIQHTALLEALSRAFGERNWSTLRAQLEELQNSKDGGTGPKKAAEVPEWDASQGPMSDAQYVRYGTNRCPACGSRDLDANDLEADGNIAWDETTCEDCGATWSTVFEAKGYNNLVAQAQDDKPAIREDIVEELVEDVRSRARKYGFAIQDGEQAEELAHESNDLLNLSATQAEIFEAALRLA